MPRNANCYQKTSNHVNVVLVGSFYVILCFTHSHLPMQSRFQKVHGGRSIIVELHGHGKLSMRIAKNTFATILRLLDPAKMILMILMVLTLQPLSKPPLWTPASDRSKRAPPRPTTPATAICVQMDVQVVLPFVAPASTSIASIPQ